MTISNGLKTCRINEGLTSVTSIGRPGGALSLLKFQMSPAIRNSRVPLSSAVYLPWSYVLLNAIIIASPRNVLVSNVRLWSRFVTLPRHNFIASMIFCDLQNIYDAWENCTDTSNDFLKTTTRSCGVVPLQARSSVRTKINTPRALNWIYKYV